MQFLLRLARQGTRFSSHHPRSMELNPTVWHDRSGVDYLFLVSPVGQVNSPRYFFVFCFYPSDADIEKEINNWVSCAGLPSRLAAMTCANKDMLRRNMYRIKACECRQRGFGASGKTKLLTELGVCLLWSFCRM